MHVERVFARGLVLTLGWILIAIPRLASGDPIRVDQATLVTSGQYVVAPGGDTFRFSTPNIEIQQTSGAMPPKVAASTCATCTAGDIVNLSFRNPPLTPEGFTLFVPLGEGSGRISEITYPFLSFSGSLKFQAAPIAFPDTDAAFVLLHTPFSFRGWFRAGAQPGPFTGGSEFRFRGAGTASAGFFRDGDTYRWSGNTTYQVQPVPEPSTLLLLGSGLAALGRARWRRMRGR